MNYGVEGERKSYFGDDGANLQRKTREAGSLPFSPEKYTHQRLLPTTTTTAARLYRNLAKKNKQIGVDLCGEEESINYYGVWDSG